MAIAVAIEYFLNTFFNSPFLHTHVSINVFVDIASESVGMCGTIGKLLGCPFEWYAYHVRPCPTRVEINVNE